MKNIEKKSDEDLVSLSLKNPDYFLPIVRRYEDKLFRYIRRISNLDKDETEDVLQDVFIKVYKNLNSFDSSLKFSSWVYRIAHNETISNYRKRKNKAEIIQFDVDGSFIKNIADEYDLEKEFALEELKEKIALILAVLDLKYREVLVLRFLEAKNYSEISDILKKPEGTVATLLNRAKKNFLKELKKQNNG